MSGSTTYPSDCEEIKTLHGWFTSKEIWISKNTHTAECSHKPRQPTKAMQSLSKFQWGRVSKHTHLKPTVWVMCAGVHAIAYMWKAEGILGYLSLHFSFWNKVSVVCARFTRLDGPSTATGMKTKVKYSTAGLTVATQACLKVQRKTEPVLCIAYQYKSTLSQHSVIHWQKWFVIRAPLAKMIKVHPCAQLQPFGSMS